jgi:hypothetical protein
MRIQLVPLALVVAVVCADGAFAQTLPPPRVLPPEQRPAQPILPPAGGATLFVMPSTGPMLHPSPLPPPGYRPSAYQVWQYYGITYQGWLRPRVIQANGSGYYLYNGYPYPYVNVSPEYHFNPMGKE